MQTQDTIVQLVLPISPIPTLYSNPGGLLSCLVCRGREKEWKGVHRQGGETEKKMVTLPILVSLEVFYLSFLTFWGYY